MASACACSSSMAFCRTGLLPDGTNCFCSIRLVLVIPCRCETRRRELVALQKIKAIIMCLDKAHLCCLTLLESTVLDNQDRLQSSRTRCHQCMHTHTHTSFSLFQHTMHHLVAGGGSWSGHSRAFVNDELFGLLFRHPRSHTFPVIGYEVGPIASNAGHTFIHVMCDTNRAD